MDLDLTTPQKLLKDSARELLSRQCKPRRVREIMETETADDANLWREIADQGWTGLTIPEEYGGLGLGLLEMAVVSEEMGRACVPGPFLSTLFSATLIERAGSTRQKEDYLGPIAAGEKKATVAQLEESASWDFEAIKFQAKRDNGYLRLTGRKLFVPDAAVADHIICVARSGESLMLLPVEGSAAGLSSKMMRAMDATRKIYQV